MSITFLPLLLSLEPLAAEPAPVRSVAAAWAALSACEASSGEEGTRDRWERAIACGAAARDVLRLGDEADRDRLWDRYQAMEESDPLRSLLLAGLVDSHVADAIGTLGDAAPAPDPPPPPTPEAELPAGFENVSPELKEAIRLFQDLWSRAWPESPVPETERIPYRSPEGRLQFEKATSDFLRGRGDAAETRAALDRFVYGGGCGNGAASFVETRSAIRLIGSIRDHRVDAAAAVAYALGRRGTDEGMAAERRVLRAAGVEWEPLYLGALASGQLQAVAPLVRAGSDRTARLLIELADMEEQESIAPAELRRYLLTPMATFVSSDGPCDGYETVSSWDATRDADAPSIDPHVQQAILDRLAQAVQPEVGLDAALDASHALLRLCRAESRDAFHAMLHSPYGDVRERGVLALRALGEAVAHPVPPAPVEIRLLVDGRTWEPPVTWELQGTANHRAVATADREGVLRLDRDPFVDPTSPIESVAVGSDELTSPEGTWFSVRFKPPADLDDRTLLSVRTGSLTVVVPPEVHPSPRGQPAPFLMLFNDPEDREEPVITHLPVRAGRYVFPHLQHGRYLARVFLPDATVLESPRIEVGERPGTVELEPVASPEDWIDAAAPDEHDPLPEP